MKVPGGNEQSLKPEWPVKIGKPKEGPRSTKVTCDSHVLFLPKSNVKHCGDRSRILDFYCIFILILNAFIFPLIASFPQRTFGEIFIKSCPAIFIANYHEYELGGEPLLLISKCSEACVGRGLRAPSRVVTRRNATDSLLFDPLQAPGIALLFENLPWLNAAFRGNDRRAVPGTVSC